MRATSLRSTGPVRGCDSARLREPRKSLSRKRSCSGTPQRAWTKPRGLDNLLNRLTSLNGVTLTYLSPTNGELATLGSATIQNNLLGVGSISSAGTTSYYARDPNGTLVSQRTGTATPVYYLQDMLGSTTSLLDGTSIVRDYSYDPDGNGTTTGTGTTTPFKFAGGHDVGNGLYHYGARYYNPDVARWTQPDPLSSHGALKEANRYLYAGGDPLNAVDPLGLFSLSIDLDIGLPATSASIGLGLEIADNGISYSIGGGGGVGGALSAKLNPTGTAQTGSGISGGACVGQAVGLQSCYGADRTGSSFGVGLGTPEATIRYEHERKAVSW